VSNSRSASVTITLSGPTDTTVPAVTAFSIPSTSSSLTVPISTLTASDNVGVIGYLLTETSTKPAATAAGWTSSIPASYTFASAGTKTLYAWAKDAAGNVSNSRSASVTITITSTSGVADISTANSLDFESVKVKESEKKTLKVTNKGTAKMTVSKVEVVGTYASAFKPSVTAFNVEPSKTYELKIEFKPAAKGSYSATLKIHSNDPDTPVKGITLIGKGVDDD
ncbi:MAG: choice-of-anchor D domain-containing protein, partial [Desulfatirhabdiaceae bacterium]